jgi:hypothetical protein
MRIKSRSLASLGMTILLVMTGVAMPMSPAFSQRTFCFWPHPLPKCESHFILEFDANRALLSTSGAATPQGDRRSDYRTTTAGFTFFTRYDLSIGAMHNDDERHATGIVAGLALDRSGSPTRIELRRHYWRGEGGWSVSGGLATRQIQLSGGTFNTIGATVGARAENRYLGVQARAEVTRGNGRTVSGVLVGAHTTTRTTPLVGAMYVVAGIALLAFLAANWNQGNGM